MYGNTSRQLPFRVHIFGPTGSGKTTFAEYLQREFGVLLIDTQIAETSDFLIEQLASYECAAGMVAINDWHVFEDFAGTVQIYKDSKEKHRQKLIAFGNLLTGMKPDALIAGAAREGSLVIGARRKIEFEAWFGNGYRGYTHPADVLVEIVALDTQDSFELAGWAGQETRDRQPGAVKYKVEVAKRDSWPNFAKVISRDIAGRAGISI